MEPIKFPEQNKVYAENQPQYKPLPVFQSNGCCVSCWKLSFKERMRMLFLGKLWLSQMTFNEPLQPIFPSTKKSDIIISQP